MKYEERLQLASNVIDLVSTTFAVLGEKPQIVKNDNSADNQTRFDVTLIDSSNPRGAQKYCEFGLYVFPDSIETEIEVFFHYRDGAIYLFREEAERLEKEVMDMIGYEMSR